MSLQALQSSIPSSIPGPVTAYGLVVAQAATQKYVYDGQFFPRFLLIHGGDPTAYRSFLRQNQVGDPFAVEPGTAVQILQAQQAFSAHPEA